MPSRYSEEPRGTLALVVPCYNEDEVLEITIPRLLQFLEELSAKRLCAEQSFVVMVDDGSSDNTWEVIAATAAHYPQRVRGLRLAHNVGHQGALLAGLDYVTGKCGAAVSMDADLQDDLTAIPAMIEEWRKGAELVLGVRESRETDTWFKRNTALGFYRLMKWMGVNLVENHADFRLMSDRALRNLHRFPESNLFLRGLMPLVHQRMAVVSYRRAGRLAGKTKYPLGKMLALAWNGITSFSVVPLHLVTFAGFLVFLTSLFMIAYAVIGLVTGSTLPGWASVVIPLYLLGGLIMLSIGVVGEYVGKLFLETKRRPRFLIDTIVGDDE